MTRSIQGWVSNRWRRTPAQLPERGQHRAPLDRIPAAGRHEARQLAQFLGQKNRQFHARSSFLMLTVGSFMSKTPDQETTAMTMLLPGEQYLYDEGVVANRESES